MGLFGDIFKTITAPARFVAKSPLGQVGKMAAPMVMGPAGIGVSAGIGALERSDEGVDDMLMGGVESGAQGAASYGMGKGVGALIGKYGGGAAAAPGTAGAADPTMATGAAPGPDPWKATGGIPGMDGGMGDAAGSSVLNRATVAGAPDPSAAAGAGEGGGGGIMDKLGLGDMPPWLKWSMLLKGGTDLAGTLYDVHDNERARKRGANFADALVGDQTSRRPTPSNYGSSYDPAGDIMRRRRQALEREF